MSDNAGASIDTRTQADMDEPTPLQRAMAAADKREQAQAPRNFLLTGNEDQVAMHRKSIDSLKEEWVTFEGSQNAIIQKINSERILIRAKMKMIEEEFERAESQVNNTKNLKRNQINAAINAHRAALNILVPPASGGIVSTDPVTGEAPGFLHRT